MEIGKGLPIMLLRMTLIICASLTASYFAFSQSVEKGPLRPNIILIMCDDLGWGDVGFNGNQKIQTPHLDQLASQGMVFSRFYSAGAVCSPTRASCITGRNPYRMGIYSANTGHMRHGEITLPELLRASGYTTGHFGKWHLGTLTAEIHDANRGRPRDSSHLSLPIEHGYDEYFCTESKVPTWDPMLKPDSFRLKLAESLRYGWHALEDGRPSKNYGTFYWSGPEQMVVKDLRGDNSKVIMNRAIPFIEGAVAESQPFFTTIWLHTPHLPVVAAKKYRDLYRQFGPEEQLLYGTITAMDEQVGRLWARLHELGVADQTILWFCSDNGPERDTPGSSGPYRARKRSLYEGGVRVPAFCVWPEQIVAGSSSRFPCVTSDYLPTIIDVVDISYPDKERALDGISLQPVLRGSSQKRGRAIGFQNRKLRSWVGDRYKLISPDGQKFELYDLLKDPSETTDVAGLHPSVVMRMKTALIAWVEECRRSDQGGDY